MVLQAFSLSLTVGGERPVAPAEGRDTSIAAGIKRPGGQFGADGKIPDPKRKRI